MEEEGIGMVLIRATELRSKITNCIEKPKLSENESKNEKNPSGSNRIDKLSENGTDPEVEIDGDDDDDEGLMNIRDAFEVLESQLSSLQALQQQQMYEREAALAEIDYSRKTLLTKLREYKGDDLQVIHDASAFASESVNPNNHLILPPYPTRSPGSLLNDKNFLSKFSTQKSQNGLINGDSTHESENKKDGSSKKEMDQSTSLLKKLGFFLGTTTKIAITFVGVISVLSLVGFEPRLRQKDITTKLSGLFEKTRSTSECPPGKIMVVEDGESRCLVKERVAIPFESFVSNPDVKYGCG